jgi:dienelactone hydrolase
VWLDADLALPQQGPAAGVVLFAHGSGSGRHSPRNRQVAHRLQQAGIATVLLDLLTAQEEQQDLQTRQHRFDIALLGRRMQDASAWAGSHAALRGLPIGYFGASTGSAAALVAAAQLGAQVQAVVSRGGRPDLAGPAVLASVTAATLLVVGGADHGVIELNRQALQQLRCERELRLVPGATHLFAEPGAIEQVCDAAARWFAAHFAAPRP